jgi:AhpD family alkylhydroperoxidase
MNRSNLRTAALLTGALAVLLRPARHPRRAAAPDPDGARLRPARARDPVTAITYLVLRRRYGHVLRPFAVTGHHPPLLAATIAVELVLERSNRIDRRLEELAALRASTMTGCAFCIDFGSALVRDLKLLSPQQIREVTSWRESEAFDDDERLVLEYAEGISSTPVDVSDALFARLRERFDEAAIVELSVAIAFENYRGRYWHAAGLGSDGFCALPERDLPAAAAAR